MAHPALDVAKHITHYCDSIDRPITNLHLQKILYFAWIDYYNQTGNYLFEDDMRAWKLGPVVSDVYDYFRIFVGNPIILTEDCDLGEDNAIIESITDEYRKESVYDLVNRSHEKGKPWAIIYKNGAGSRRKIPFDLIIELECNHAA